VAGLVLVAAGCFGVRGSGTTSTETRQVAPFTQLELRGGFNLVVHLKAPAGETVPLQLSGDDNLLSFIRTRVSGERLVVDTERDVSPESPLVVTTEPGDLTLLEVNGACDGRVEGIDNSSFKVETNGAGEIVLKGRTGILELEVNGAGEVNARELRAESVRVSISGAGEIMVCASKKLDVKIAGAGEVGYDCDPAEVTQDIAGAGEVKKL